MLKVGDKVGMLTLLSKKKENKRTYFWCKCDCGNKKWIRADCIGIGKTVSCGCYNAKNNSYKPKDIKGKVFGRLTALYPTEYRDVNGSVIWNCKCSCGNFKNVSASDLVKGVVKSCGCFFAENRHINGEKISKYIQDKYVVENTNLKNIEIDHKLLSNNTSGYTGVTWDKNRNKWIAQIVFKDKRIFLGRYTNIEDAIQARKEAEYKYFKPILDKYNKQ